MKKLLGILRNFFAAVGCLTVLVLVGGGVVVASWMGWHL